MSTHPYCPEHDQPLDWCAHYRLTLLGKAVEVTLGEDKTVVTGVLLDFDDDGGFVVRDDNGGVHHSWPMLNVRPA